MHRQLAESHAALAVYVLAQEAVLTVGVRHRRLWMLAAFLARSGLFTFGGRGAAVPGRVARGEAASLAGHRLGRTWGAVTAWKWRCHPALIILSAGIAGVIAGAV
ncbi:MAG: hypothetical protein AB1492_02530 [Bacillota bacterium]